MFPDVYRVQLCLLRMNNHIRDSSVTSAPEEALPPGPAPCGRSPLVRWGLQLRTPVPPAPRPASPAGPGRPLCHFCASQSPPSSRGWFAFEPAVFKKCRRGSSSGDTLSGREQVALAHRYGARTSCCKPTPCPFPAPSRACSASRSRMSTPSAPQGTPHSQPLLHPGLGALGGWGWCEGLPRPGALEQHPAGPGGLQPPARSSCLSQAPPDAADGERYQHEEAGSPPTRSARPQQLLPLASDAEVSLCPSHGGTGMSNAFCGLF